MGRGKEKKEGEQREKVSQRERERAERGTEREQRERERESSEWMHACPHDRTNAMAGAYMHVRKKLEGGSAASRNATELYKYNAKRIYGIIVVGGSVKGTEKVRFHKH